YRLARRQAVRVRARDRRLGDRAALVALRGRPQPPAGWACTVSGPQRNRAGAIQHVRRTADLPRRHARRAGNRRAGGNVLASLPFGPATGIAAPARYPRPRRVVGRALDQEPRTDVLRRPVAGFQPRHGEWVELFAGIAAAPHEGAGP